MYYPPLGLWYVWAALETAGHQVGYYDLDEDWLPLGYDQVWVSGTTPQAASLRNIAAQLKSLGIKSVLGGPHAWLKPESAAEDFDLVVRGDVFTPTTANLVLRAETGILQLSRAEAEDITIPERAAAFRYQATLRDRPCTTMMTSLGCPYRCAFCSSQNLYEGRVRYVPFDQVLLDLEHVVAGGYTAVQFYDDILPIKKDRTLALADALYAAGLIWRCFLRSDLGVRNGFEFLKTLREKGLVEVLVGVESASNTIKDNIHKGTTQAQDTQLLKWCKELGITYKASLILGLPGETWETLEETRQWLLRYRPDKADINVLVPMMGTPLYDDASTYDCHWQTESPEEFFFKGKPGELTCLVHTDVLSSEEILDFRNALVAELNVPY